MELIVPIIGALLIYSDYRIVLPIVPGLPISLLGILIMQWTIAPFSSAFVWGWTLAIVLLHTRQFYTCLDKSKNGWNSLWVFGGASWNDFWN